MGPKEYLQILRHVLDAKLSRRVGLIPRGPLIVFLALTQRCNLRCKKCTIGKSVRKEESELSREEIFALLSQLSSLGTKVVALWGGEPLLNKDLFDIIREIHRLKMFAYVVTNGLLLNERNCAELVKAEVGSLSVSLDHPVAQSYDAATGINGAFARTCEGIALLRRMGGERINFGINTVVSKDNVAQILGMAELACSLKLDWLKFIPVHFGFPYNEMEFGDTELMPKEEEIELIHKNLFEARRYLLKRGLYTNSTKFLRGFTGFFRGKYQMACCYAGYLLCNVDSYGNVNQCSLDPRIVGNIRKKPFDHIWKSKEFQLIRRDHNRGLCGHCWLSCFIEPSFRMSFFYSVRNVFQLLTETSFVTRSK